MDQVDNKLMNAPQTTARKILDFLIGFLAGPIVGNLALVLLAQLDPQRMWIAYFKWFWILILAGLAVFSYTRKRIWLSIGIGAAIVLLSL